MATKKKTDVVEEIKEVVETPVEEAPKKTTAKKTTKKKVEVPAEVVEEVKEPEQVEAEPEVEVVGKKVAEVIPEEVKVEKEEPKAADAFLAQVVSPAGIYTFKNPGIDQPKGRVFAKGTKLAVSEVKGNWGKVGDDMWILLSGAVAKI